MSFQPNIKMSPNQSGGVLVQAIAIDNKDSTLHLINRFCNRSYPSLISV